MKKEYFGDFSKKVVFITGAAGLIGSQYAEAFSEMGASLVLGDIDYRKCKELERYLKKNMMLNYSQLKLISQKGNQ